MLDKLQIFVSIFASIVIVIISIVQKLEPQVIAIRLVFVIIVFYAVGTFAKYYLKKNVFFVKADNLDEEEEIELNSEYEEENN